MGSMAIQTSKVLRGGKELSGTYREATIMQEFAVCFSSTSIASWKLKNCGKQKSDDEDEEYEQLESEEEDELESDEEEVRMQR